MTYTKKQFKDEFDALTKEIELKEKQIKLNELELERAIGNVSKSTLECIANKTQQTYDDLTELKDLLEVAILKNKYYNGRVVHSCGNN